MIDPKANIHGIVEDMYGGLSSWEKVSHHFSGVPMSPSYVDGIVYRSNADGYYRRMVDNGLYNIRWWGVVPNQDTFWDSHFASAIDSIPDGDTLFIPAGTYPLANTLDIYRPVNILGRGSQNKTILRTRPGHVGVRIRKEARGCTYQGFLVWGQGGVTTDGKDAQGNPSTEHLDYDHHGIFIDGVVTLRDIGAKAHSGHGIVHFGNISDTSNPSDSSNSKLYDCYSYENNGSGYVAYGPDANAIKYFACSSSDNGMHGFLDASFLGVTWFGPMCHYNAMGDYYSTGANARTTNIGQYGEGGSPPSKYASVHCNVIGGINESSQQGGLRLAGNIMKGSMWWGNIRFEEDIIKFDTVNFSNLGTGANWGYSIPQGEAIGFAGIGATLGSHEDSYQRGLGRGDQRTVENPVFYSQASMLGGRYYSSTGGDVRTFLGMAPYNRVVYLPGDYYINKNYTPHSPAGWRCFAEGEGNLAQWRAEGAGRGTLAQRPSSLHADDAGWQYFVTDQNRWDTWNGAAWQKGPTLTNA